MVSLLAESWTWYAVVLFVAASRIVSRRMTLKSFARFQPDDWFMLVLLGFYTAYIPCVNIVNDTDSNLLPPGFDVSTLTPDQIAARQYGSKIVLVVEQCQCVIVFGAKACLMVLYLRLTTARWENLAIKILSGYIAFGFVFMEVFYFAVWCRPFYEYFAVPTSSTQCSAATDHLITNAVFNLSSDLIMLAIGLPMFLRMRLPLKKKIPLVGIFSLGVFVILAAILNKNYSFQDPFGEDWTFWYVREASCALLVANLPFVWTLWRRVTGQRSTTRAVSGTSSADVGLGRAESKMKEQPGSAESSNPEGNDAEMEDFDLSLEDMLAAEQDERQLDEEHNVSLYTHPQRFLARQRRERQLVESDPGPREKEVAVEQPRIQPPIRTVSFAEAPKR